MEDTVFKITDITAAIKQALDPFVTNLSVTNVASVLAITLTSCLALYLFYWGARKGLAMLKSSFSGGGLHF